MQSTVKQEYDIAYSRCISTLRCALTYSKPLVSISNCHNSDTLYDTDLLKVMQQIDWH